MGLLLIGLKFIKLPIFIYKTLIIMNINELEIKYDHFVNSFRFPSDVKNRYLKKNAELDKLSNLADNLVCNMLFLKHYFEKTRDEDPMFGMANNYSINVDGGEVILNVNESPDFKDKNNYLNWLLTKINS